MKTIGFALVATILSATAFAQEFLTARVETKNGAFKVLTKCALENQAGNCKSFYFYYSSPGHFENDADKIKLISPVAFTTAQVNDLKVDGLYYNVLNGGDAFVTTEDFSVGLNVIWIPLALGMDVVGGAMGTPFFAAHKIISNVKYKKLLTALERNEVVKMSHQGIQILISDICQMGRNTVYLAYENEHGYQAAENNVSGCGFIKNK